VPKMSYEITGIYDPGSRTWVPLALYSPPMTRFPQNAWLSTEQVQNLARALTAMTEINRTGVKIK